MGLQALSIPRCGAWGAWGTSVGHWWDGLWVLCSVFIVSFCLYAVTSPETSGPCCLPFLCSNMSILSGETEAVEFVIPPCPCSCASLAPQTCLVLCRVPPVACQSVPRSLSLLRNRQRCEGVAGHLFFGFDQSTLWWEGEKANWYQWNWLHWDCWCL